MADPLDELMDFIMFGKGPLSEIDMMDVYDRVLKHRSFNARELAKKYPELKGMPWTMFLEKLSDAGLHLDFITASEMFDALNGTSKGETEI